MYTGNFNISKGSKVCVQIGKSETVGIVNSFGYGSTAYFNPNVFILSIISERGLFYAIPVNIIDNCTLIEEPKEIKTSLFTKLIRELSFYLLPNNINNK